MCLLEVDLLDLVHLLGVGRLEQVMRIHRAVRLLRDQDMELQVMVVLVQLQLHNLLRQTW